MTPSGSSAGALDWPNLIVGGLIGAVLGAGVTVLFWLVDRARARRTRIDDARDEWERAAQRIESVILLKASTAADVYRTVAEYPIDRWRRVLGPHDFRVLENVQRVYVLLESTAEVMKSDPQNPVARRQFRSVEGAWRTACVEFVNMARTMRAESYNEVTAAEARAEFWRDMRRHPISTIRRERHNRRVWRQAGFR